MTLEEAIRTAIEYETRIRDLYRDHAGRTVYPEARKLYRMLGDDEQYHLDYLGRCLLRWKETGRLDPGRLQTTLPEPASLRQDMEAPESAMARADRGLEQQMLSKALQVEVETSDFYRRMVESLPAPGPSLFEGFLEIENRHISAVQAELDYLARTGYWFGTKEFDME